MENSLVARPDISMRQQVENVVRARAADDTIGVEPVARADGLAQLARRAFWIGRQLPRKRVKRLDRARRGAERRLVGG